MIDKIETEGKKEKIRNMMLGTKMPQAIWSSAYKFISADQLYDKVQEVLEKSIVYQSKNKTDRKTACKNAYKEVNFWPAKYEVEKFHILVKFLRWRMKKEAEEEEREREEAMSLMENLSPRAYIVSKFGERVPKIFDHYVKKYFDPQHGVDINEAIEKEINAFISRSRKNKPMDRTEEEKCRNQLKYFAHGRYDPETGEVKS